ncbi:MAG TPA: ATP-binding protein, partial [Acidimicrobiia bacterium]|nr:ATP-binding protein [Acidimicrobiia bacterium]
RKGRESLAREARELGAAKAAAEEHGVRLGAALDALEVAVIVADSEGVVVHRNAAALPFWDARHADAVVEDVIERAIPVALSGVPFDEEVALHGPPRRVLVIGARPLAGSGPGSSGGAVAFVRDITDLRRTESIRRDFVANVSHELKTPIGALGILAETIHGQVSESDVASLVDRLADEAERLGRIVDDLLDLSLVEGQDAPNRDHVSAASLALEAIERVRAIGLERGLSIVDRTPAGTDVLVRCDARQVVSALTNLLDNALKYSEPDSEVSIEVGVVDDRAVFAVRDAGIGIPSGELERVFERFYRVDKARSRGTGGTGLGLAIVRHIAESHGGEVVVESREGEGSVFSFLLPVADPELPLS